MTVTTMYPAATNNLLTLQGKVMAAESAALRKRLTDRYRGKWEKEYYQHCLVTLT